MRHFPLLFLSVNFLLLSFVVLFVEEVSAAPAVVGDNKRKADYLPNKDNDNSNKLLENKTKNTAETKILQKENLSGSESAAAVSSAPSTVDIAVNSGGGYDDSGVDDDDGEDDDDDNVDEAFITGDDTGQFTSSSIGNDYSNSLTSTNYHNNYHEPVNIDHLLYPVQTLYGGFGGGGGGGFGFGDAHYDYYGKGGDHGYDHHHHSKQPDYKSDYKSGHVYHHHQNPQKYHDKKQKHKENHHDQYKGGGSDHHKKDYHKKDDKNDDDQLANATRTVLRQRTRSLDGSVRCRVFGRLRERPSSLFYNRLTGRIRNRCRLRGVHVRNNFGRKRRRKGYHHHHHHHYDDHDDDHYHDHYDHDDDNYYRR